MKLLLTILFLGLSTSFAEAKSATSPQVIEIVVTEKGYEPSQIEAKAGVPLLLKVTRKTDATCATDIQIPTKNIKKDLPLNKTTTIEIGKLEKGTLSFSCGMNMIKGDIIIK